MRVGSLFSGIGGLDLGLERAGMRVAWQVECDPYARAVLRKHWPGVPCYEDVRTLRPADLAPVDFLCGGFPCQDISAAGNGAGLGGERSGLWFHYARLLGALRPPQGALIECTPPWKRWLPVVRRHLHAAGYSSLPLQLSAAQFGAKHLRSRIFVVAHPDPTRLQGWLQAGADGADAGVVQAWDRSAELAPADAPADERPDQPVVGGAVHGIPARVDRIKCLGNAVLPQIPEWLGRLIMAHAKPPAGPLSPSGPVPFK